MKHTPKTKARIVERVCSLYESQNATLESCCQAAGISYPTFNVWCHADPVLGARFRKARRCQQANYWEEIIKPKAQTALLRLLEGADTVTIKEVAIVGTEEKRRTVSRKSGLPDVAAVLFVMKGLYPGIFGNKPIPTTEITAGQALRVEEIQPQSGQQNGHRKADQNNQVAFPDTSQSTPTESLYRAHTGHQGGRPTPAHLQIPQQWADHTPEHGPFMMDTYSIFQH